MPKPAANTPPVAVFLSAAADDLAQLAGSDSAMMDITARAISSLASHLDEAKPVDGYPGIRQVDREGLRLFFFVGTPRALAAKLREHVPVPETEAEKVSLFILGAVRTLERGAD